MSVLDDLPEASGGPREGGRRLAVALLGGDVTANASLGMALVATSAVTVSLTVEAIRPTAHQLATYLIAAGASVVVALPFWRLRRLTRSPLALLVFPLIALGSLTVASALAHGMGDVYAGFFLLAFVYIGLTQRPGTSSLCVAVALPAWIVYEGRMSAVVDVKMPITVLLWVLVGELLSQRVQSQTRARGVLAVAASTDPLTSLHNRRELEGALGGTAPGDAIVMIDLDQFKRVNDEHGHEAGDRVLAEFGRTVVRGVRSGDVALRYGGDEVLLLLTRAGHEGAETFLERLRAEWSGAGRPTFSAGVAVHQVGISAAETLRRADRALYAAKRAGGDVTARSDQLPPPRRVPADGTAHA
jgi:diguanylate cyclase (GGDEF)-like protein